MRSAFHASWLTLASGLSVSSSTHEARACAMFTPPSTPTPPSIAVERTLIVQDPAKGMEHFIRQIAFRKATTSFGFVVPVPSQPEIAKLGTSPFEDLETDVPMVTPPEPEEPGFFSSRDKGMAVAAAVAPPPQVTVLSVTRVGSFTAFVLAADDAGALSGWLTKNGFDSPASARPWLEHYTNLHFYYTAFRFDPPPPGEGAASAGSSEMQAETIRISFASPLPFYPYLEPDAVATGTPEANRVLDVWLVSPAGYRAVAAVKDGTGVHWKQPWFVGDEKPMTPDALAAWIPRELLPAATTKGTLIVQPFEDQKTSRHGFGDVVMVPKTPDSPDEATLAKRRALEALLAPSTAVLP